jgi:hypothetical protein
VEQHHPRLTIVLVSLRVDVAADDGSDDNDNNNNVGSGGGKDDEDCGGDTPTTIN